jgi:hypothetical protein
MLIALLSLTSNPLLSLVIMWALMRDACETQEPSI